MPWKLPDDRNERMKIFFMIGLVSAGILYALIMFAILPFFATVREDRQKSEELDALLWQAERDVQQTARNRQQNTETIEKILAVSEDEKHILEPNLGNYRLVAEEILDRARRSLDIEDFTVRNASAPPPAVPEKGVPAGHAQLTPYTVTITLRASLHDVTRYVKRLQQENPYLALTTIAISASTDSPPVKHQVTLQVQWPVWTDPATPNRLAAEHLADGEQS